MGKKYVGKDTRANWLRLLSSIITLMCFSDKAKWERDTHQAQFLCFNTQLRPGVSYFGGRQSPLNYMKHLIKVSSYRPRYKNSGTWETGYRRAEKDRFPAAAVRPRVIRFLIYGEHLMLLVRRERKRKEAISEITGVFTPRNAGASDRVIRGKYILLL